MNRYQVIDSDSMELLTQLVEEAFSKGWKAQGGVCAYVWPGFRDGESSPCMFFAQSLVKEEKP